MSALYFTEEHELFRQSLRTFLDKEVKPFIDEWEEKGQTPRSIWKKMGDQGFLGLGFPKEYGGSELDFFYDVVFLEETASCFSGGFCIAQCVVQYMSGPYISKFGSDVLKQKYLPGLISGEGVSSIGITEPGAGSDVQNIKTTAIKQGDYYVVNGSKTFITNGVYGDILIAVVKTDPSQGAGGVSLLVIDLDSEGVSRRKLNKLGWRCSDTAELSFDNVKVPVENIIGQEGMGFYYLMQGLQLERLSASVMAYAGCETAMQYSFGIHAQREAFNRPINKFQVLRHRVAQLSSEIEATKQFVRYTCKLHDMGEYAVKESSMSKLLSTELSDKAMSQCLQFFGGYGFIEDFKMARAYRDTRVGTIGGGTSEIMREIIAKMVIDDTNYEKPKILMDALYFTPEHELFRQSLRSFFEKEAFIHLTQWEQDGRIPRSLFEKMGRQGFLGMGFDPAHGGNGLDFFYDVILIEEMSRCSSGGLGASIGASIYLAAQYINRYANDTIRDQYMPKLISGEMVGALAITEPVAGSDVAKIKTTAIKQGDFYQVNGGKLFITNGVYGDIVVAVVKTDPEAGPAGVSLLLIDLNAQGVSRTPLHKLGWRSSDTAEIHFDNVQVPVTNLIGSEGMGFYYLMQSLQLERLVLAIGAYASCEYYMGYTLRYMNERQAFGRPINKFQVLRHQMAQLSSELERTKQFVRYSSKLHQMGEYAVKECSMAKLLATELSNQLISQCLQCFGGYGFIEDFEIAGGYRDTIIGTIGGGTSDIMREIIAKMVIDDVTYGA